MKYSRALVVFLTAYIIVLIAVSLSVGGNGNVDAWSVTLTILWVMVVQAVLLFMSRGPVGRFILWLATFLTIFFWIPFFGYLLLPSEFPGIRELEHGRATMNTALAYLLLGTVMIVVGYWTGIAAGQPLYERFTRKLARRRQPLRELHVSPRWFFVCAAIFLALDAYTTLRFGVYFVGDAAAGAGTWWRRLLTFSLFNLVGTVNLVDRWPQLRRRDRVLIGLPLVLSCLIRVLSGSRSAIFYTGLFVLQFFLVKYGDFRVRTRLLAGLGVSAIVAILLFPVASQARYFWSQAFTSGFETGEAKAALSESVDQWHDATFLRAPLARLDLLQVALIVVDGPADPNIDTRPYLGFVHDLKSLVNIISPGEPFPGVLEGSLTPNVIYLGLPVDYFTDYNRVTTTWTMWGLAYALLGFAGGLVVMFFWSAACTFTYRVVTAAAAGPFSPYLATWLFIKLTEQLQTFGFDLSMAYVVYDLVAFVPPALLLSFGMRYRSRAGGLPPKNVTPPSAPHPVKGWQPISKEV